MSEALSLMMDILVLASLGMTIFFALRLSKSLNSFRQNKNEFTILMQNLSGHIAQAYEAIDRLQDASEKYGGNLQRNVSEARHLVDELQLINEAGNALASRLENLAGQSRQPDENASSQPFSQARDFDKPARSAPSFPDDPPSFFIQDRDYEEEDDDVAAGLQDDPDVANLPSRAEQELMAALKKTGKAGGRK